MNTLQSPVEIEPIFWTTPLFDKPKVNSASLEYYLHGLQFPATKNEIIKQAESNLAPENVMAFYRYRLPERTYHKPSDVSFTAFMSAYFFGQD
ncbi:MAG: DUF2795 domain-containing protein [Dehalogenimonas sp.]